MKSDKIAILVTAYCGGNDPEYYSTGSEEQNQRKHYMARTLAKHLSKTGYHVCYSSHSALDQETQRYCNSFIYDSDNSWQINGLPRRPNHGVAEMTAIVNGLMLLKIKGFEKVLKLNYDQTPTVDYAATIDRCQTLSCQLATYENATDYGMMSFYGDIDFVIDTLPLDQLWRCEGAVETAWYQRIRADGLADRVHGFDSYTTMYNIAPDSLYHHSYVGSNLHEYPYE